MIDKFKKELEEFMGEWNLKFVTSSHGETVFGNNSVNVVVDVRLGWFGEAIGEHDKLEKVNKKEKK